jgi:Tol biopolymer transport system component
LAKSAGRRDHGETVSFFCKANLLLSSLAASHLERAPTDWSPDGKFLLMVQDINNSGRVEIWQLPVAARPHAEGVARRIASKPDYDLDQGHYSLDGRWIVFEALRTQPQGLETTLYVMAAAGGPWIRITDGQHFVYAPCWSPDGKTIYFVSGRSGFLNVWGIGFDPAKGKPVGLPFSVTALNSLSLEVPRHITGSIELSLTAGPAGAPFGAGIQQYD